MTKDVDIEILRASASQGRIHWHQHALERFLERGISRVEAVSAVINGEIVEAYPADRPYPSCLILGVEAEPVHVVVSVDPVARICHVITAYRPDLEDFESDFKTRRQ